LYDQYLIHVFLWNSFPSKCKTSKNKNYYHGCYKNVWPFIQWKNFFHWDPISVGMLLTFNMFVLNNSYSVTGSVLKCK
jgi:hypothetical protein